jgi:hypothetical protein
LNAVLHLSELSDQLDVTLQSSKIVKLARTWVATYKVPTKQGHRVDHTTKLEAFLSRQCRSSELEVIRGDGSESALSTSELLQGSAPASPI